jgi:hypothetical protein
VKAAAALLVYGSHAACALGTGKEAANSRGCCPAEKFAYMSKRNNMGYFPAVEAMHHRGFLVIASSCVFGGAKRAEISTSLHSFPERDLTITLVSTLL